MKGVKGAKVSTPQGGDKAPEVQRLPNPDVLQAILTRMEWFEREQMFLVREGGQESKGAKAQKCKGASEQRKEVTA